MHKDLVAESGAGPSEAPFKRPKKWSQLERLCPHSGSSTWLGAGRDVIEKNPLPKIKARDLGNQVKHLARLVICS